ncbi:MAG: hypothetical protein AB1299_07435 [Thermoproteota archaeon]
MEHIVHQKKTIKKNRSYKAVTPISEVFIRFEINEKAGMIYIHAGPTEKQMTGAFMRIMSFSENSTGVTFTFF